MQIMLIQYVMDLDGAGEGGGEEGESKCCAKDPLILLD